MARYTGAVCKLCRREGTKLFLKGDRCYTDRCAVSRRAYPPGQHGQGRKKNSEYGLQLRAKQMTKRYYGVLEKQFKGYYEKGAAMQGKAGDNLLILLESRLDNVVYRTGWASSRAEARQLVTHGHFTIGGKRVDIPSYLVKPGEMVAIKDGSKSGEKFKAIIERSASRPVPGWIDVDAGTSQARIESMPTREDIDLEVDETLIVELYSK